MRKLLFVLRCIFPTASLLLGPVHAIAPDHEPVEIVDDLVAPDIPALLAAAAARYDIPPDVLQHRAFEESRLNPNVPPNHGCHGLMQLNELYFPGAETMSPEENIDKGAKFLKEMGIRCGGDWKCAELAYRFGPAVIIQD